MGSICATLSGRATSWMIGHARTSNCSNAQVNPQSVTSSNAAAAATALGRLSVQTAPTLARNETARRTSGRVVVQTEVSHVPVSSRELVHVGKSLAAELKIPSHRQLRFTRSGWLRYLLARHNLIDLAISSLKRVICIFKTDLISVW